MNSQAKGPNQQDDSRGSRGGQALQSGRHLDEASFEALYLEHWSAIFNYVRYRLGPAEAQDIAAEVFARAWSRRAGFDPERGSPTAWLWGIARHATVDWARRQRRHADPQALQPQLEGQADALARNEERNALLGALKELGDDDREVIALRFGMGLGNREVARLLGLTDSNAAVRLHRALQRLRLKLGD